MYISDGYHEPMKRVSVAEARNRLPALLHDAEREPIQILRRGKPVAVIQSQAAFDRSRAKAQSLADASAQWRERYRDVLDDEDWLLPRDTSPTGGRKLPEWR